jgi:hypothetical protein
MLVVRSFGLSIVLLMFTITFEEIVLFNLNLVYIWVLIRKRFGLYLSQIGLAKGSEMGGNK